MVASSRNEERRAALRFSLVALGWLACLFAWISLLSFDIADPPSTTVWPNSADPRNLCGRIGAMVAYYAFHYVGLGAFPALFLMNVGVLAWSRGAKLADLWLRFIGLLLVTAAGATASTLVLPQSQRYLVTGPGGVLGTAIAAVLPANLQTMGTALLLTLALVVGLLLAADNLVIALFRWLRWAGQQSGPVLVKSGSAVASAAGAAVAAGVSQLSSRAAAEEEDEEEEEPAARAQTTARPTRSPIKPLRFETPTSPARDARKTSPPPPDDELEDEEEFEEEFAEEVAPGSEDEPVAAEVGEPGEVEEAGKNQPETAVAAPKAAAPKTAAPTPSASGVAVREMGPRTSPPPTQGRLPFRQRSDEGYELPSLDLLERSIAVDRAAIEGACREKAYVLEQTLNEFRLEVQVVAIETGPVITVFELKLAPGIKVSQIASLSNDMARALKAPAVRVVAPLPGKSTIGIEVPNIDKEKVRLRDVIELAGSRSDPYGIPLYLGKDASGQPLVADLTRMPHLLIAGTTGSGKSVCITSLIMSVLLTRSPAEVQMILVDPKVVELAMYKDVPHLMCPIVTEVARAECILEWASTKMDERYALLAEVGVKDIRGYNRLGAKELRERIQPASDEEMEQIPVRLPYIVIMIDELADLMMTSAKEVEFHLCRIAQKSRAVGIHLIVSTQRPQANVVTGLIKSNMPCRIAFRVASRLDSRIVLDQNGGEVLMGQGDMLFLPPGCSKLVRAQGTFVGDEELRAVVKYCRQQRAQDFHPELIRLPSAGSDNLQERDELFDAAVEAIVDSGRGSVSLLQRRFNVGYSRASRLVDQMFAAGIVGEYKGSQAREVLLTRDEWEALKSQRDREEAAEQDSQV